MTAITVTTDHARPAILVDAIMAAQQADASVAPRSRRALARGARTGRLVVAYDSEGQPVGWVLSEPCTARTTEWGAMYVVAQYRDGRAFRQLTAYALAMRPRSIVVTMDQRFADWLLREWNFTESSLWGVTAASAGVFLWRRMAPWRLVAALRHVAGSAPRYLILERA